LQSKVLYETQVHDNSYLNFPWYGTEITAGGPKITLEGPVPLDTP